MILHCTKKLAAKLPGVSARAEAETSPLGSWHAHIYIIDRHNCLLFCHDETRYTLFLPGLRKPHFTELGRWFRELFTASLAYMEVPDVQIRKAELALGPVVYDSITDRSVVGTLTQMSYMLDARVCDVANVMQLDPLSVSRWLCHTPVRVRDNRNFWWPDREMAKRIMAL